MKELRNSGFRWDERNPRITVFSRQKYVSGEAKTRILSQFLVSETTQLSFYNRFVDQQDRNSVADRVHAMAVPALEDVAILVVRQGSFTGRAGEHVDEIAIQHNAVILYLSAAVNSSHACGVR